MQHNRRQAVNVEAARLHKPTFLIWRELQPPDALRHSSRLVLRSSLDFRECKITRTPPVKVEATAHNNLWTIQWTMKGFSVASLGARGLMCREAKLGIACLMTAEQTGLM